MLLTWSGTEVSSHTNLCLCVPFLLIMNIILLILEGFTACLLVLISCVIGIANGPENMVFFYDQQVQDKVVELGLINKEKIKRNHNLFLFCGIIPYFIFVVASVCFINKARGIYQGFIQLLIILLIEGVFDRLFIDWYWVNHTKAWIIPGTEEYSPYIHRKTWIRKWLGTLIGFPIVSIIISLIMSVVLK